MGIEICAHQLRYALLQRSHSSWILVKAGIINDAAFNLSAWQELRRHCQADNQRLILGVALNDVLIKQYSLARDCRDHEINAYLQQQAQHLLALQQAELALDYEVIDALESLEPQKRLVRMIAARKQLVTQLLHYCHDVGLRVSALDVTVLSLKRIMQ